METMESILNRRSIRAFTQQPISRELLEEILSATQMAPSWKNTQTVGFVAALNPEDETRKKIMDCLPSYNARIVSTAAAVIFLTTKKARCGYNRDGSFSTRKEDRWEMFDAGIAAETLCLAAYDKGLGSCIMGLYDEDALPALLQIPEDQYLTAVIALGYPDESPVAPKRKDLSDKVRYV